MHTAPAAVAATSVRRCTSGFVIVLVRFGKKRNLITSSGHALSQFKHMWHSSWRCFTPPCGLSAPWQLTRHKLQSVQAPFNLWRVGDFIADRGDLTLEPNFGPGKYRVYFGLYSGNRRLEVHRGAAEENRLDAGFLEVR